MSEKEARSAPYVDTWRHGFRNGWIDALTWAKGKSVREIDEELKERKQLTKGRGDEQK